MDSGTCHRVHNSYGERKKKRWRRVETTKTTATHVHRATMDEQFLAGP